MLGMSLVPFGNFEASLTKLEEGPETLALILGSDSYILWGVNQNRAWNLVFSNRKAICSERLQVLLAGHKIWRFVVKFRFLYEASIFLSWDKYLVEMI